LRLPNSSFGCFWDEIFMPASTFGFLFQSFIHKLN
jgi:hypothetical protein